MKMVSLTIVPKQYAVALIIAFIACASPATASKGPAESVKKSIVKIITYNRTSDVLRTGTGFVIDNSGRIATSRHILDGASRVQIETDNGLRHNAILDESVYLVEDLAILRSELSREEVRPLRFSDNNPAVGEMIYVYGHLLDFGVTESDGRFIGLSTFPGHERVLEISAFTAPGSSGSPVLSGKGEVVAIVAFGLVNKITRHFALPVHSIKRALNK